MSLQTALTRTLDSVCAYQQAASISESGLLSTLCKEFASTRNSQADKIAGLMGNSGTTPDFGFSREAGFQQIWMCLVNRRFPTFREGLPRECERSDRRLERVLLRLWNDPATDDDLRHELGDLLREVRGGLARLHRLRDPQGSIPMSV